MDRQSKPHRIAVTCPNCGKRLKGATTAMIGETGICPKCKTEFELSEDKKGSRTIMHILLVPVYLVMSFLIAAPLFFRHPYTDYDIGGTSIVSSILVVFNYPAGWMRVALNLPDKYVGHMALAFALVFLWPLPVLAIRPGVLRSQRFRMAITAYCILLLMALVTGIRLIFGDQ